MAFFVEYFDTIEEIDLERRGISEGNCGRGVSKRLIIRLLISITVLKCFHFFYLYFAPLQLSDRVLFFDFVYQITGQVELNLGMAFVSLMTGYFYHLMYLTNYNELTCILRDILVYGELYFFLEPFHRRSGRPLNKVVLRTALLIINGLQCFIFAIGNKFANTIVFLLFTTFLLDLLIVLTQVFMITYITINWEHLFINKSVLYALCWIILLELNAFLSYLFLFLFGNICILISTIGVIQAFLFLIKQKQIVGLLWRRPPQHPQLNRQLTKSCCAAELSSHYSWRSLERFTTLEVVHVLLFNRMNDTYGSAFLTFLLINCPMSVRLLSLLMLSQLSDIAAVFFVLMYFLHQVSAIFGMHLVATRYSTLIHSPPRRLVQLFGRQQQQQHQPPISRKLKVVHFIFAFHVRNRYGAYYGKSMGKISMTTFVKVSLLPLYL